MSKNSTMAGKTPDQEQRILRAAERRVSRELLTIDQQLRQLDGRPGQSVRERKRLQRQQEVEDARRRPTTDTVGDLAKKLDAEATAPAREAKKRVRVLRKQAPPGHA